MRRSGIPYRLARFLATTFSQPKRVCEICGIPQYVIDFIYRKRWCLPGGFENWRRLHLDHIIPEERDNPENLRLTCYRCNNLRGRGRYSDETIRLKATRFWSIFFGERLPWVVRADAVDLLSKSLTGEDKSSSPHAQGG